MFDIQKKPFLSSILVIAFLLIFTLPVAAADTDAAKTAFNEGLAKEKENNTEAAITAYKASIAADENFIDAYINLGTLYFVKKEYDNALKMFKSAVEKDDKNVNALTNLGKVNYALKRYVEAETNIKSAIALTPTADLYVELGKVYYKKKNNKEVIETLNKAHGMGAGNYLTYYMVAKAYKNTGKLKEAIAAAKESIAKKSKNYNANSLLGSIYLNQEKYGSAAGAFRNALKSNPKMYRAAYNYAVAVENDKPDDYTTNINNWNNFVKVAKNNPKAKNDISIAKDHVEQLKKAQENAELQ